MATNPALPPDITPAAPPPPPPRVWTQLRRIGPGLITGAADVDPALVFTALIAGATFRYSLLWVVLLCVPLLLAVFSVSARIGDETREGLVTILRHSYSKKLAITCALLVTAINLLMIIADLMAVSAAFAALTQQSRMFFVTTAAFSVWYVLIFKDYQRFTHALVWLTIPLLGFVYAAIRTAPPPETLLYESILPSFHMTEHYVGAMVALFGSLLTPYLLVWQTSSRRDNPALPGHASAHKVESRASTFTTCLVSASVMIAAAGTVRAENVGSITIMSAADALKPLGAIGPPLMAIAIIGAGLVALPILTASLCYSLAEAFGWESSLNKHPWEAQRFYLLISGTMVVACSFALALKNPATVLYLSQILAGTLSIPILLAILVIANDPRIMRSSNSRIENFWIGGAIGGMLAAGLALGYWKLFR